MELEIIKHSMYRHIKAYNNKLTIPHLKTLTEEELLNNCGPLYREGYARLLYRSGFITVDQVKQYGKMTMKDE